MKIAYILSSYCYYTNVFSGVVVQAKCWAESLSRLGHKVEFVRADQSIDWKSFDLVHLFQHGSWCDSLVDELAQQKIHTVYSPIIDPPRPYGKLATFVSKIPFERLRLHQNQRLLRKYGQTFDLFLSRSNLERRSLEAVGVPTEKIVNVPISVSKDWNIDVSMLSSKQRKPTVFHVSHLAQQRKNVRLLIEVAIKRDFNLRLAGSLSDPDFAAWLMKIVEEHPNIAYLGRISDEELMEELLSCSVFCLPSLYEGVGLVALDAGYCGANLAITSAGGTRDYLGSQAIFFDPRDSEALGDAISASLAQPLPNIDAHLHVAGQFSKQATGRKLEAAYVGLLG